MKRIFRELLIIPTYIVLLLFKNLEYIAQTGSSALKNLDLVNWPLSIGIIIFSIIFIFYDELKKYKKAIFSVTFVTLGCMIMQGFFAEKQIYRYILVYLILMYNSIIFSRITKQRFEVSLFGSVSVLLLIMFVIGLFNLLNISIYIIGALEVVFTIVAILKRNTEEKELYFNSWSIVVFSILFVAFVLGGIDRYVHIWDEYSHWGYDAKAVITYEKYTTCEESVSATKSYPPYISLWHFFINKIMGGFEEGNLYSGLSIFVLICLMPSLSFINKKNKYLMPFYAIIIMFGATLFSSGYGYTTLYADYAQAAAFANCFIMYLLYRNKERKLRDRMLFLAISVMLMIRPTGIITAFIFFVVVMLIDYIEINNYRFSLKKFWKNFFKVLNKWLLLGISVVALYFTWNIYLRICNAIIPEYYDAHIISEGLRTDISAKLNSYVIGKVLYYLIKLFDEKEFLDFTVTQFGILLILVGFCICYLKEKNNNKDVDIKKVVFKVVPFVVGWFLFLILNVLAMFIKFPTFEVQTLPGLLRYMDGYNVAMFILLVASLIDKEFFSNRRNAIFSTAVILILFSQIKATEITFFATDLSARQDTRDVSYERQDKLAIINENTPENSKVYIIDQEDTDGIMALWYARYYNLPRKINAYQRAISWKIRTEKNADDLQDWGLTAKDLEDDLYEYQFDYIFFYSSDDLMYEEMKYMFEDYETAKEYTLFKINFEGENVKLEAVK